MDFTIQKMNQRIQWIVGIATFIISFLVYFRTVAPTTSYWDCGEFIASSYILGVMHPPGSPLYLLIGRILTMIPFVEDIGLRVNMFSVFISAATVWLTFLIVIQFIKRWRGEAKTLEDRFILFFSAFFGALAFAFTDSQWFNAVEAEVYAFSTFFTAAVIYLALLWGERSEKAGSLLLIFFIFYLMGLATGVHLLNILAFPFVLLIAYFHHNETVRKLLLLIFVQGIVPIILYVLFFSYDPAKMNYQQMMDHQAAAGSFMKWFGLIWIIATLVYFFIKDKKVFKAWWVMPVLVIVGYSTYMIIYIRANLAPPINENDPSTLQGMIDYLARKQYGTEDLMLTFWHRKADFISYQINMMYIRYFGWQFIGKGVLMDARDRIIDIISFRGLYGIPFLVGLWGAVHHFFKDWKRALSILLLFILTGFAIIIYLNQPDPQPRERDYSYVGSFFAFALWIGIGMAGIFEQIGEMLRNKKQVLKWISYGVAGVVLFVAVPVNLFAVNFEDHDRSGNYVAFDYSYNILQSCEENAILFTNGDNDTFPVWFLQEVMGIRKDVRVVNLSLLNTHWYIKQLRDFEPQIPLAIGRRSFSDKQVEKLYPIPWEKTRVQIPVPESVLNEIRENPTPDVNMQSLGDKITWELAPTYVVGSYKMLRVQDLMILRILQTVQWKRPVYFAVTVSEDNKLGMNQFLRMDGLTFKVMPYVVKSVYPDLLKENLFNKYQYRGLQDKDVFYNVATKKLLQNYRSAFLQLAMYYYQNGDSESARNAFDKMHEVMPDDVIPYNDERSVLYYTDIMRQVGMEVDLDEKLNRVIKGRYMGVQEKIWLASYYSQVFGEYEKAEDVLLEILEKSPNNAQALTSLAQTYKLTGKYEEGLQLLQRLRMQYPGDKRLESEINDLREKIEQSNKENVQE